MPLIEFADTKPYTLSADDAAVFLKQLERVWPHEELRGRPLARAVAIAAMD